MISVSLRVKKRKNSYIGYIFLDSIPIFCYQDEDRDLVYQNIQSKMSQVKYYG